MSGVFQSFFGRAKTPEERMKEWKSKLRAQSREIDKELRGIEAQENKIKQELKQLAKKPAVSQKAIKTLATELVRSQKAKDHLLTGKTHINSVMMQMQEQASMVKVTGCLQKNTQVMKSMNSLMKLPQMRESMYQMSKEMMKAGLMEDLVNETMESLEDEGEQEIVDAEVDNIVNQILEGKMLQAVSTPKSSPGVQQKEAAPAEARDESDEELSKMQAKLQSLK
jgi:charged multivesicular body protein 3